MAARCRFPVGHRPAEASRSRSRAKTIAGKHHTISLGIINGPVSHGAASNMKPFQDLNIRIPAAIAARPDLNLIEKAILTRIHERPACSNGNLAKLTGLSVRGVESTLARLKRRELIRSRGHGQARRLLLTFPVERHAECGENVNAESHTKRGTNQHENTHMECGIAAKPEYRMTSGVSLDASASEFPDSEFAALSRCMTVGEFDQARRHLHTIRHLLAGITQDGLPSTRELVNTLRVFDDIIYVLEAGWPILEALPDYERFRVMKLLDKARPERITEIRKAVEVIKAQSGEVDLKRLLAG